MVRKQYLLFLLGSLFFFSACDSSKQSPAGATQAEPYDLVQAGREINKVHEQLTGFFSNSDSAGLADMFTPDGKLMEPNSPAITGKDALLHQFGFLMKGGISKVSLTTTGLWGDDNLLVEEGKFSYKNKRDLLLDEGKYIMLWKKTENQWKIFRQLYNSNWPATTVK